MDTWLAPKKAAKFIQERNGNTMIRESTIRKLIEDGFPCLKISSRYLVNIDTFENDLLRFRKMIVEERQEKLQGGIRQINV